MVQKELLWFWRGISAQVSGSGISQMAKELLENTDKINDVIICGQHMELFQNYALRFYTSFITTCI